MDVGVKKIVGLKGFCNSGKTSVLRALVRLLIATKWNVLRIQNYAGDVLHEIPNGDYVVTLEHEGKIVVVATGGDCISTALYVVEVAHEIAIEMNVNVILVAAMRMNNPDVFSEYLLAAKGKSIPLEECLKPGFKRTHEFKREELEDAENLWVRELVSKIV